jgi:hypothetical protein
MHVHTHTWLLGNETFFGDVDSCLVLLAACSTSEMQARVMRRLHILR